MRSLGWPQSHITRVPVRREEVHVEAHGGTPCDDWGRDWSDTSMHPQAREHHGLLETPEAERKTWERWSPRALRESAAPPTPSFQMTGLQSWEGMNSCCFEPPICCHLLQRPSGTSHHGHLDLGAEPTRNPPYMGGREGLRITLFFWQQPGVTILPALISKSYHNTVPQTRRLQQWKFIFHNSGGQKSEIKALSELVFPKASLLGFFFFF